MSWDLAAPNIVLTFVAPKQRQSQTLTIKTFTDHELLQGKTKKNKEKIFSGKKTPKVLAVYLKIVTFACLCKATR